MARLFGTDGVRGLANAELTPELAMALAASAARVLAAHDRSHRPVEVVGRDPRASGEMLEAAVVAGLTSAGAEVVALHADPDGININQHCGSNHPEQLREAVVAHGADLGIAHDGDADRCVAVDSAGELVDGDQIMAVLALALAESGELTKDTLVATVMSNLGLHLAMKAHGIHVVTTAVGDRYVLEALRAGGFALGGEESGHVVRPDNATTG